MWQSVEIARHQPMLDRAIAQIPQWNQTFSVLPISQLLCHLPAGQPLPSNLEDSQQKQLRLWGKTQNLIDISFLMLKAAAFRQDYPRTSPRWQADILVQGQQILTSPYPSPSE